MNSLTGDWAVTIEQKSGIFNGTLHLEQAGKALHGYYSGNLNGQSGYRGTVLNGQADETVTMQLMWDSGNRKWSIVGAEKKQEEGRINLRSTGAPSTSRVPVIDVPTARSEKKTGSNSTWWLTGISRTSLAPIPSPRQS